MTTKGFIFSAPMVRALYDGRKTQTRRLINPQPETFETDQGLCNVGLYLDEAGRNRIVTGRVITKQAVGFAPKDRLYVREAAAIASIFTDVAEVRYKAHERAGHTQFVEQIPVAKIGDAKATWPKYRPSIHMPRAWSRLWLDVTEVRIERLQDITEYDALAEGIDRLEHPETGDWGWPQRRYADLWNSLHTTVGTRWEDNPWIVAITSEVHHGNIDAADEMSRLIAATGEPS